MNLTRTYNQYNHYVRTTTGTKPKLPPENYEDIHKILGDKHKSNPPLIQESMEIHKPSTSKTSSSTDVPSQLESEEDATGTNVSRSVHTARNENETEVSPRTDLVEWETLANP